MEQSPALPTRFQIDVAAIERTGRSFEAMLEQRLCAQARRRLGSAPLLELIRQHCAEDFEFLHPDLPLLEACFRVFLLNENKPLTVAELRQELDHWPSFAERLRLLADEQVAALFQRDRYYSIRPLAE
ncbi:MAG: hypothetical protein K6U89_11620 [Chloroflexi bacterium]|nr:hypothetical protein [Chloroflexota bacterium]GIW10677.1 MAG: hypothetical protein KatS3mg061_1734 [Dehalococcoidia bacterium]